MTKTPPKDVGASVRSRLLNLARERREDFQYVLTRYANERLLFRIAASRPNAISACLKQIHAGIQFDIVSNSE